MLYSHIVFQPPDPPSYEDTGTLCIFDDDEDESPSSSHGRLFEIDVEVPLVYMETEKGNTIVGAFFHKYRAQYTILFSHVSILCLDSSEERN